MNAMTYKGYAARIEYSEEDGCFVGHLACISDIVGFHGESVAELELHARMAEAAQTTGKSLNAWATDTLAPQIHG